MAVGRGARLTWLSVSSVFAVAVLGFGTMQVAVQLSHEQHTEVHTFAAERLRTVEVHDSSGSVRVVGSARSTVRVKAEVSDGLQSTDRRAEVVGDRLVLRTLCPFLSSFCNVTYDVEVPSRLAVVVRTDDDVDVRGVRQVDASTDNGSVHVRDIAGPVALESDNGRVEAIGLSSATARASSDNGAVRLHFLSPPRSVDASSDNGSVEVVVPRGQATYRVDAKSGNGPVHTPIRTDPTSSRAIRGHSDNGSVTIRYPGG